MHYIFVLGNILRYHVFKIPRNYLKSIENVNTMNDFKPKRFAYSVVKYLFKALRV